MENLQQKCKDPVDLKAVVDQKIAMKSTRVFFGGNFYRSDDVSSVAYFYLNRPYSNLPAMKDKQLRIEGMKEKVWTRKK